MRYVTITDVIEQAVTPALGEYQNDYDTEAIARDAFTWTIDTDAHGNQLLHTAGFEQTVSDEAFWSVAAKYERTA